MRQHRRARAGPGAARRGCRCQRCPLRAGPAPLCACHRPKASAGPLAFPSRWYLHKTRPRSAGEAGASVPCRGGVMRAAALRSRLVFIPVPQGLFDLCACSSCCLLGFSCAALGQSVLTQTNLEIISCLAVPRSPQCWSCSESSPRVLLTGFICLLLLGTVAQNYLRTEQTVWLKLTKKPNPSHKCSIDTLHLFISTSVLPR